MADSGVDPETGAWVPAFEGQRPPFPVGHTHGTKTATHGAYAELELGRRAAELVDDYAALVPSYRPSDQVAVQLLALCVARCEAAMRALEDASPGEYARLEQDLRGWVNRATSLVEKLGMTPTSRARLGVDVAVARRQDTLAQLHADAAGERRGASA